jgi:thioredoxin-dependent peroxiredoxin
VGCSSLKKGRRKFVAKAFGTKLSLAVPLKGLFAWSELPIDDIGSSIFIFLRSNYPLMLKEGDKAPAFSAKDQNGKKISLGNFKGKKVVLYFYPEDDTPTCTIQACNLRDNYSLLKQEGFEVLGVSPDDEKKHKKFEQKFRLPFTLLADPSHKILEKYGVWGEKQMFGNHYMGVHRTTFAIDEKGIIRKIFYRPKNKAHAEEIVKSWKEM